METLNQAVSDLLKPRTIISIMLYATFCYLAIVEKIDENAVIAVISALMTFYYSQRIKNGKPPVV